MRLISGNQLLPRFKKLVGQAGRVDIAVAWAKPCDAVEVLARGAESGTRIRIAVGLSMNGTKPEALLRLQEFAKLRIALPRCGIFHPKFYSFRGHDGTICWVGSSNLTAGGFGGNVELVCEYDDDDGEGQRWFKALWNGDDLDRDPGPVIAAYIENYVPPKPSPRHQYRRGSPEVVPLGDQTTWRDFVEGLRTRDDYCHSPEFAGNWDILGDTHSYLHTIARGREVAHLEDWVHLGADECDILTGNDTGDGTWGLLGNFSQFTRHDFVAEDGDVRGAIHELLGPVLAVPDDEIVPVNVAHDAVQAIRQQIHNFGPAAATRLVTLARPDCLVSVNGESAPGLGELSGVAYTANGLAGDYAELLNWVHQQPWFTAPEPDDPLEREIWNSRAALIDAFVYPLLNRRDG